MNRKQKKMLARILISAVLLVALNFIPVTGWLRFVCYMVPYLIIGYDILIKAGKGIMNRQVTDENFLMALATVGALAIGEYPEAVFVMLFYQVGELFQSYAVDQSRKSITALMDIRPDYANMEGPDGQLEQVDPEDVAVGDTIVIKAGERIPIHEFHYWESTDSGNAFQAEKASNGRTWPCIHASGTLFAGFPHIHFCSNPRWAQRFLEACVQYEEAQKS